MNDRVSGLVESGAMNLGKNPTSPSAIRIAIVLLASAVLTALGGCSTETIVVDELREPARVDLRLFGPVAIDDPRGDGGLDVAEELIVALTSLESPDSRRGVEPLEVLDRRYLDRALRELGRSRGDEWDPEAMARLGRLVSARSLIHGRVSEHECTQEISSETWKDGKGKPHTNYTRRAVATVSAYLQASEVETGKILAADKIRGVREAETSATDKTPESIDCNGLLQAARRIVVEEFLRSIVPYRVSREVVLFVDGDLPKLDQGNGYAKLGDWPEARRLYEECLHGLTPDLKPHRYKPLYNLAIALELLGAADEAIPLLKEAYSLHQASWILEEIERLQAGR